MTDPDLTALRIEDPQVRFYLDNRGYIEEWVKLRAVAAQALSDSCAELLGHLRADAEERGLSFRTVDVEGGPYPRGVIEKKEWVLPGQERAPFGVAFEWESSPILKNGDLRLYVALRGSPEHPLEVTLKPGLVAIGAQLKQELGSTGWAGTSWSWPCYRYIHPSGTALDEVELLRTARELVWILWDRAHERLDALIREAGSGP